MVHASKSPGRLLKTVGLGWGFRSAFVTGSCALPMLLVQGPHLRSFGLTGRKPGLDEIIRECFINGDWHPADVFY